MIHHTPLDGLDHVVDRVIVEGKIFQIERPAGLDQVFDHPAVRSAYAKDEYIPYWADLWSAARMLAKVILREPWTKLSGQFGEPLRALEIGCGLGLAGIAALSRGLHVTFSDCDQSAVNLAGQNATRNGFKNFELLPIDVRSPLEVRFPVLLGSDVMYEERLVEPLVAMIERCLLPGGVALIADPDRMAAKGFRQMLQHAGLDVETSLIRAGEPGGERTKGTLYRITRRTSETA